LGGNYHEKVPIACRDVPMDYGLMLADFAPVPLVSIKTGG